MRHLVVLSSAFPPDNLPGAVRPRQIYDYFPKHGFQPVVFASSKDNAMSGHAFVHRVPTGNERLGVRHVGSFARWFTKNCAPYDDRLDWAPYAASAAAQFIRNNSVDAIFSTSPFLATHVAGLWLKSRFKLPWLADFRDPIRDNPFRLRRWIYPYDTILERTIFRNADWLLANTDTVAAAWEKRYPRWADKISVLWSSFDPREEIGPGLVVDRPYRLMVHVGSLYGGRHPGSILAAMDRIGIERSFLRLKLIGTIEAKLLGSHERLFSELAQRGVLEFENRQVPRREALNETGTADFLLLLDLNEKNASFQVPSKLLEYIRAGKPILAYTPKDSPVESILAQSGIPYLALDAATVTPADDQRILAFLGQPKQVYAPSRWFDENLSANTQMRILAELVQKLCRQD